jgi:hypothetical protein
MLDILPHSNIIYLSISYAHVKENKQTLKRFVCLGLFWMLDISFIHSNHHYPYHIHMWRKPKKKNPFWMLDMSFIQSSLPISYSHVKETKRKPPFWMLDISFIQIIITHVIFTCEGNQKIKPFLDVGYFIHSNHWYPYHMHMRRK